MRWVVLMILAQVVAPSPGRWENPNAGRWTCPWALPDMDQDGDVDSRDWYYWTEAAGVWPRVCEEADFEANCCRADFDRDGDIDYDDLATIVLWMNWKYHPIDFLDWCCLDTDWHG